MIREANAQLIYGNACRVGISVDVRRYYDAKLSHNLHISMAKQKMNESSPLCPEKFELTWQGTLVPSVSIRNTINEAKPK